jgi:sulfur carrier protein
VDVEHTGTIPITVNGEAEHIPRGENLLGCLARKNINLHRVVCELNEKIIRRSDLETTILQEGDTLEIITMMGGG